MEWEECTTHFETCPWHDEHREVDGVVEGLKAELPDTPWETRFKQHSEDLYDFFEQGESRKKEEQANN